MGSMTPLLPIKPVDPGKPSSDNPPPLIPPPPLFKRKGKYWTPSPTFRKNLFSEVMIARYGKERVTRKIDPKLMSNEEEEEEEDSSSSSSDEEDQSIPIPVMSSDEGDVTMTPAADSTSEVDMEDTHPPPPENEDEGEQIMSMPRVSHWVANLIDVLGRDDEEQIKDQGSDSVVMVSLSQPSGEKEVPLVCLSDDDEDEEIQMGQREGQDQADDDIIWMP